MNKKTIIEVDNGSAAEKAKKRKIIMPPRNNSPLIETTVIPATDILLHDARCILAAELARYRAKSSKGVSLDLKEARVVQGYLETLIRLQKEEREEAKQSDFGDLDDNEIAKFLIETMGKKEILRLLSGTTKENKED